MKLASRFRIIGYEAAGLGLFSLLMFVLESSEADGNVTATNFAWIFVIIGITLILVGLETLSLTRKLS